MISWLKWLFGRKPDGIEYSSLTAPLRAARAEADREKARRAERQVGQFQNADPLDLSGTGNRRFFPLHVVPEATAAANQQAERERIKALITPGPTKAEQIAEDRRLAAAGWTKTAVRSSDGTVRKVHVPPSAPYGQSPRPVDDSTDIYAAMALAALASAPAPAPEPEICRAPSFSSGGGGAFGGGGASSSWDSGSSSSSDSGSSSSSDSGSSSSSSSD